jgi:hypothetical protein
MPLRATIAALVLFVTCSYARAGTTALGEALDTLYRIDFDSSTAQPIGPAGVFGGTPISSVEGLTYSPDGQLYAAADNIKALVKINPSTGAATYVGSMGLAGQGTGQFDALDLSMAFTCDGKLWAASANTNKFWRVDPATGATTFIGTLNSTITGLVTREGMLYGAGGRTTPNLYLVDTATAGTTNIGSYGAGVGWITAVSPGFDATGKLWAVLNNDPPGPGVDTLPLWSDLGQIASGGALTDLGNITGPAGLQKLGIIGLAIAPPACGTSGGADSDLLQPSPTLSAPFMLALLAFVGLIAGTTLRQRRPNL